MSLPRSLALSLLLALPAFATTRDELVPRIDAALGRQDYAEAVDLCTQFLATAPRDTAALLNRGLAYGGLGRRQEAALDFSRADAILLLEGGPPRDRAIALTNRADALRQEGDLRGAFADAFAAKALDPASGRVLVVVADTWYAIGSLQDAQAFLAEARKNDSSLNRTYTADEAARNAVGKTRPDDKADLDADFAKANTAQNEKKYEDALALYDHILALSPLAHNVWGNRGIALRSLKRLGEAILSESHAAALASVSKDATEDTARHLANRLSNWIDVGDGDAAVVDGLLATKTNPDSAWTWTQLALAWYAWGDLAKAQEAVATAKEHDPKIEGYPFSEKIARLNAVARQARTGDRTALAALVTLAQNNRLALFEPSPEREFAVTILDALLARTPRDVDLLLLRAEAQNVDATGRRDGTDKEAIDWVEKALAVDANHPRALLLRGLFRLDLQPVDMATRAAAYADLDRAIELGTKDVRAFAKRADHRTAESNALGAIDDLTAALALKPDDLELLRRRAHAFEMAKTWPNALEDRTRLIALEKKGGAYADRAEVYLTTERWRQALADFNQAIELEPTDPNFYLGRARAYRLQNQLDLARPDYAKARELDSQIPELAADLANAEAIEALRHDATLAVHRAFQGMQKATEDVMKAAAARDRSLQRMQRAFSGDRRKPEEIEKEVAKDEAAGTADAEDYRDLGRALAAQSKFTEALAALEKSLALEEKAATYELRGRIFEVQKNFARALLDYDQASTLEPENANYRRERGDAYWDRRDYRQALGSYEAAVKLDPTDAANWLKRGNAHLALRQTDEAIADYDKVLELKPDNEAAKNNREIALKRKAGP